MLARLADAALRGRGPGRADGVPVQGADRVPAGRARGPRGSEHCPGPGPLTVLSGSGPAVTSACRWGRRTAVRGRSRGRSTGRPGYGRSRAVGLCPWPGGQPWARRGPGRAEAAAERESGARGAARHEPSRLPAAGLGQSRGDWGRHVGATAEEGWARTRRSRRPARAGLAGAIGDQGEQLCRAIIAGDAPLLGRQPLCRGAAGAHRGPRWPHGPGADGRAATDIQRAGHVRRTRPSGAAPGRPASHVTAPPVGTGAHTSCLLPGATAGFTSRLWRRPFSRVRGSRTRAPARRRGSRGRGACRGR